MPDTPTPPTAEEYEEILADHRRLVRELDVLINGEEGAAKQASLCDIVAQVRNLKNSRTLLPPPQFSSADLLRSFEVARVALNDPRMATRIADAMDESDRHILELRDKLEVVMQSDVPLMSRDVQYALDLFLAAYEKWNGREDGGEDDLHYAAKVARGEAAAKHRRPTHPVRYITLVKICSIADPRLAVYVARSLAEVQMVCHLIGTSDTVWSSEQVAVIGAMAKRGECDYHDDSREIHISLPLSDEEVAIPAPDSSDVPALVLNTLKGCLSYLETPGDLSLQEVGHLHDDVEQAIRKLHPAYFDGGEEEDAPAPKPNPFAFVVPAWVNSGAQAATPQEALDRAREAALNYYALGAQTGVHSMIEWCGVMGEYVKMLEMAMMAGIDPREVDQHHEECEVLIPEYMAKYFTEKLGCQLKPFIRANRSMWRRLLEDWFEGVGQHIVCEIIEQKPAVSLHATEEEALEHAAQCALENLKDPDSDVDNEVAREGFMDQLAADDSICEGDYEVHMLLPSNRQR